MESGVVGVLPYGSGSNEETPDAGRGRIGGRGIPMGSKGRSIGA